MKKKGILQLVFFTLAQLLVLSAAAQNESIVTLSGNAYITSGQTAFIDKVTILSF